MNDSLVNHPSHYNVEGKKECIEQLREDYGETITAIFCLTNAYKYLYRAGHKDDLNIDIQKAKWYYNYFESIKKLALVPVREGELASYIEKELEKYN